MRGWMRTLVGVLLVGSMAMVLAGCQPGEAQAAPPTIRYGEDTCSNCGMIINDPRFAAGYAVEIEPGRFNSLAFDDIGDMLGKARQDTEQTIVAYYVHDYSSEEWVDADQAHFVVSREILSPMGSGIAAHATAEAAAAMASDLQADVMSWDELQEYAASAMTMQHSHAH
jgi:copper chaperone NosL